MYNNDKLKAYGAAVIFSILVGFSFLGVKTCIQTASTIQILAHRYNWAFLFLLLLIATKIVKVNLRGRSKKNLFLCAGFYIAFMALQTVGLIFATSVESAIIFAFIPIITKIIAGILLKEHSTGKQNIFMGVSVSALILMIVMGASEITTNLGGVVILIVSSACMATSNVYMRYVREEYRPVEITAAIVLGGFLLFNLTAVIYGMTTGTLHEYFTPMGGTPFVIATAYLGICCIFISAQLMAYMLAHMEAVKATIFGNVSTAISIVAGVIWLSEPLLPYHIICTVLIIAGVVGVSFSGGKK